MQGGHNFPAVERARTNQKAENNPMQSSGWNQRRPPDRLATDQWSLYTDCQSV